MGVMDGETGESTKEKEETDVGCGVSESLRLAQGCRREIARDMTVIWTLVPEMR